MKRVWWLLAWVVTLISYAPVIGLVAASLVAGWLGCQLDEGTSHPCRMAGIELGDTLYAGQVLGWLMLVTWPGMVVSLGLWAWLAIRWFGRGSRERRGVQG